MPGAGPTRRRWRRAGRRVPWRTLLGWGSSSPQCRNRGGRTFRWTSCWGCFCWPRSPAWRRVRSWPSSLCCGCAPSSAASTNCPSCVRRWRCCPVSCNTGPRRPRPNLPRRIRSRSPPVRDSPSHRGLRCRPSARLRRSHRGRRLHHHRSRLRHASRRPKRGKPRRSARPKGPRRFRPRPGPSRNRPRLPRPHGPASIGSAGSASAAPPCSVRSRWAWPVCCSSSTPSSTA